MKHCLENYTLPEDHVLALKILNADRTSNHNNFQYPELGGSVTDPFWDNKPSCGGGLHGYAWGLGDITASHYIPTKDMVFQIHEVKDFLSLGDKIKYPAARVVAEFSQITDALDFINQYKPETLPVVFMGIRTVVNLQNNFLEKNQINSDPIFPSIQEGLSYSIQTSQSSLSSQLASHSSIQVGDQRSKQVSGFNSIQVADFDSVQIAGDFSFQKSGNYSKCKIGASSVQRLGFGSIFSAGLNSYVILTVHYQLFFIRTKIQEKIFFVDGKKIKADTWYKFDKNSNKLREVDQDGKFLPSKFSRFWNTVLERLANLPSTLGF